MTEQEAHQKITQLSARIQQYNDAYYQHHQSLISDYEFDRLLEELALLEKQFPQFLQPDSPTHRVGGTITKEFESVAHRYPMLSLGNTYTREELVDFDQRVKKGLEGAPYDYICEQKFDGVSISITYENGLLTRAVTRGDGVRGDDVTANVKTIRSIPLRIHADNVPPSFDVRGELFLSKKNFARLNQQQEEAGEEKYANARNTASGTLKQQDSAKVAERKLDAYLYFLYGDPSCVTHEEALQKLARWGFPVSPTYQRCATIDEVYQYIQTWETKREEMPVETDGVVIKVNNWAQQEQLGYTSKTPRWAIAFKYQPERALTKLNTITYQIGRTGAVTPVAELEPVHLAGTVIKRASLYNADEIERLDLHEGDYVWIEKGGEIIPKVTAVEKSKRSNGAKKFHYITHCPECQTALVRMEGEAIHYCPNNEQCPPQVKGRIEHFIHRKAMNIESLGEQTIKALYDKGFVRSPADLYALTKEQLAQIEKKKDKAIQNILDGIEASKVAPFEAVLFAIGIRFVGKTVAEKLAVHFSSMDNIVKATRDELLATPEIGERIADSVLQFFSKQENVQEIQRLTNAGLNMKIEKQEIVLESDALKGKTFLVSGTFEIDREAIHQWVEKNGGKILSGVSGKLNYLIAGENMGPSKKEKAEKLGVKIISWEEAKAMV